MRYLLFIPLISLSFPFPAHSSGSARLIDKLVEKGILSPVEAAELSSGAGRAPAPLDIDADFRLRWQYGDNSRVSSARSRLRYMLRASASADSGPFSLTAGIASGSGADGRSANQTFSRNMEKKGLYLDLAFLQYAPPGAFRFRGGRMPRTFWDPTDMFWDSDLRPEGFAALSSFRAGGGEVFSAAGFFALGESLSGPEDPYLVPLQAGYSYKGAGEGLSLKAAVSYYSFGNLRGGAELPGRPSTSDGYLRSNSAPGGRYSGGYDAVHPSVELSYESGAAILPGVRKISVFGEYMKNTTRSGDAAGWIAGFRAGSGNMSSAGGWRLVWSLRRLEAEAWLDVYPDSDFYGGSTGVAGGEISLRAALGSGAVLGLDYYDARPIGGGGGEKLLQTDISLRI